MSQPLQTEQVADSGTLILDLGIAGEFVVFSRFT
jgi:hypothetical protein